jgi:hypothetical protein
MNIFAEPKSQITTNYLIPNENKEKTEYINHAPIISVSFLPTMLPDMLYNLVIKYDFNYSLLFIISVFLVLNIFISYLFQEIKEL